jgi:hypothetical protein
MGDSLIIPTWGTCLAKGDVMKLMGNASLCCLVVFALLPASTSSAAIILTDGSPVVENFDTFTDGTLAKVPSGFVPGGSFTFGSPGRVLTAGVSAYNSTTGWYSLQAGAGSTDFALGGRTNATNGDGSMTVQVTNSTGAAINGLSILFDVEQYSTANSQSTLGLLASTDNSTFNTNALTGNTVTPIPSGGTDNTVFAAPTIIPAAVNYTSTIADGESVYLRFTWNPVTGGARPHFGIDNLSIQAVPIPEPGTWSLLVLGTFGVVMARRRMTW